MRKLLKLLTAIPYHGASLLDKIDLDSSLLFDVMVATWSVVPFFAIVLGAWGAGYLTGHPEVSLILGVAGAIFWFMTTVVMLAVGDRE